MVRLGQATHRSSRACLALPRAQPGYRVANMQYNRGELIRGFESPGYELLDSWQIAEPESFGWGQKPKFGRSRRSGRHRKLDR